MSNVSIFSMIDLISSILFIFQVSLMMTIVGLAQNFVGSNNLNLLQPLGQFGTRLHGGKDSASPRYIFTMLRWADNQTANNLQATGLTYLRISWFTESVINSKVLPNFLSFQHPGPPRFPTRGRQPAQVQLRRQPARGAGVVHAHHPHCAHKRLWRYRHRLGQQDSQLRHQRDRQQHPPYAQRRGASAHGEDQKRLMVISAILCLLMCTSDDEGAFFSFP